MEGGTVSTARAGRAEEIVRYAMESLKDHRIAELAPGRWLLRGDVALGWVAEVIVLHGGSRLLVHGSVDTVVFAGYSGGVDASFTGLLRWAAGWGHRGYDSCFDYISTKAAAGTGWDQIYEIDEELVASDALDLIDSFDVEDEGEAECARRIRESVEEYEETRDLEGLQRDLLDVEGVEYEDIGQLGRAVRAKVINAVCVVRKLLEQLHAKEGEQS